MGLTSDIKKFAKKALDNAQTVVVETRYELSKRIIDRTPYDTIQPGDGGQAKANWNASIGSVDTNITSRTDKDGNNTKAKAVPVSKSNIADDYYLTNSLPYIAVLEYGGYPNPPKKGTYLTSKQSKDGKSGPGYYKFSQNGYSAKAPEGMVRITVAEFDNIVLEIIRKIK